MPTNPRSFDVFFPGGHQRKYKLTRNSIQNWLISFQFMHWNKWSQRKMPTHHQNVGVIKLEWKRRYFPRDWLVTRRLLVAKNIFRLTTEHLAHLMEKKTKAWAKVSMTPRHLMWHLEKEIFAQLQELTRSMEKPKLKMENF